MVRNKLTSAFKVLTNTYGILILATVAAMAAWLIVASSLSAAAPDFTSTTETEVNASDAGASDAFGGSTAVDGTTAIVGAYLDNIVVSDVGSAYVFVKSGGSWSEQGKLTADDGALSDWFGWSVDVNGDTAIAGAIQDDFGALTDAGSAYVFLRTGTSWSQEAKLTADDAASDDEFGYSVAVDGDTAVIGVPMHNLDGDSDAGAAYVFVRSGTSWSQQAKLTASDSDEDAMFGTSVGISGDTVIVGARAAEAGGEEEAGAAYVFTRSGTT